MNKAELLDRAIAVERDKIARAESNIALAVEQGRATVKEGVDSLNGRNLRMARARLERFEAERKSLHNSAR
jgi:hypothetical protein